MEGRPWVRILLVLIGFLLLGIPVWTMTREKREVVMVLKVPSAQAALKVSLTFAEAPVGFSLSYLGKALCEGKGPQREFACDWNVGLPKEGADLLLSVDWPVSEGQTAVRVVVKRGEDVLADQTVWGAGNVVETVTVPGGKL